ncbi:hypothetical protein JNX00_17100 [Hydrogenophaga sp. YM1]|uniref:hypothetical protein n=1 Tax=Hydrogenophaga sp. YM1 TaxID=2806262 RepID=UPI00195E7A9B|nr:hypothetical protein [Hydrogenophaga sp. YM1]QRR33346.1 hypothetical protein JNX00_17100 [Hydrogenophaga sp. YM1]
MSSIELRVDVGGADWIPHTFIVVTGPDGLERGYGFAPAVSGQLTGEGKIFDDTAHEYSSTTGKIPIDAEGYLRLMEYVEKSTNNPPDYYLPYGAQCSNWAFLALTEAGIDAAASPNLVPDWFLRDVFETIVWNPYTQWLNIEVNNLFNSARSVVLQRDPLVLDLDGDGLELSAASGNVLFDHNADGIKTGTGWARPDDGFLVRDLNGNGSIDSGRELFGVDTVKSNGQLASQGFDALADLDSNGDGQITSADTAWGQLQVWRDANQDGISQAGELSGLDALGITRLGLNGSAMGPQAGQTINNNRVALSTTFTRNGVNRTMGAIDLEANAFFSEIPPQVVDEAGQPVVITQAASALPQMSGSGMVRNLRAAMSLSGTQADELEAAVAAFAAAGTRDAQRVGRVCHHHAHTTMGRRHGAHVSSRA